MISVIKEGREYEAFQTIIKEIIKQINQKNYAKIMGIVDKNSYTLQEFVEFFSQNDSYMPDDPYKTKLNFDYEIYRLNQLDENNYNAQYDLTHDGILNNLILHVGFSRVQTNIFNVELQKIEIIK